MHSCVMKIMSEDHLGDVSRRLDNICDKRDLLKDFVQIQHGGKSNMTENDMIECVELGLAQGFQ